jgi:hypothetical protein
VGEERKTSHETSRIEVPAASSPITHKEDSRKAQVANLDERKLVLDTLIPLIEGKSHKLLCQ